MEVQDWSQWHHLIFCQEMENDDQNYVVCWLCKETVLGRPAYRCLECNFLQHKSCIEQTQAIKMEVKHNLRERHHLMLIEVVDNYGGKEEVVCPGCEEPVFGPAYKCSIPGCTFLLHKPCTELSRMIQHPVHPDHTLALRVPSTDNFCNVCGKFCGGSFFYNCSPCDFDVDIKCVSRWQFSDEECHQHALFPMRKQMQFTCEACAEESKDIAYLCSICRVLIHRKCDRFPHTIKTNTHDHTLTRTYSLRQVEKHDNVFCKLCYKRVNTEYAAYSCRKCGNYITHLNCAYWVQDSSSTTEPVASNSIGYESHLVHLVEGINLTEDEKAGPRKIRHFSHPQHNLILTDEELMEYKRCEACMQFVISGTPFYGCAQCNFFLHVRCAKLPSSIKRGLFHQHPLTLLSQAPNTGGLFWCRACKRLRHGFTYRCDKCVWYNLDVQCCLIPETLKHEAHQHSLFLAMSSFGTCNACSEGGSKFVCTDCNFTLCFRCATLPLIARYEHDIHLLTLSSTREYDPEEYYCLICEEERNLDYWFYYCVKCKFTAHSRCIIGGEFVH
jgi:hypothetical protein